MRPLLSSPALLLLMLAAMLACGTATFIVQQYEGAPLPEERVAILRINGGDDVRIDSLDGEPLGYSLRDSDTRVHIEMLPGEHELGVTEPHGGATRVQRFRAAPGKVYRAQIVRNRLDRRHSWTLALFEVDRRSDEILSEVAPVPATPARPSPTRAATLPPPPAAQPPEPSPVPPRPPPEEGDAGVAGAGGTPSYPPPDPLPSSLGGAANAPARDVPLPGTAPSPQPLPLEPPAPTPMLAP